MIEAESFMLTASQDWAHWARHYDTMRVTASSFLIAIVGGGVGAILQSRWESRERVWAFLFLLIVGVCLIFISTQYLFEYKSASGVEDKLIKLSTKDEIHGLEGSDLYQKLKTQIAIGKRNGLRCSYNPCSPGDYFDLMFNFGWTYLNILVGFILPAFFLYRSSIAARSSKLESESNKSESADA